MTYVDAHSHLHFAELEQADLNTYWQQISQVAVNGTHPRDWEQVAQLAEQNPEQVIPCFGVHPWEVNELDQDWIQVLSQYLTRFPHAGVGEIGLDKWIKGYDLDRQRSILAPQLELAESLQRPVTIHCLQAWGHLREIVRRPWSSPFLLHAYAGPADYVAEFVELGAYFSFSPYFLHQHKHQVRETFRSIPIERLLLETDAPAMLGPESTWITSQVEFSTKHQHPANLFSLYAIVADLLQREQKKFSSIIEENFETFWS